MKLSLFSLVAAAALLLASAEKPVELLALWCCADSDFNCDDACAKLLMCKTQVSLFHHPSVPFTEADCFDNYVDLREYLGSGALAGMDPFNVTGDPFATIPIEEVAAICRMKTPFECCGAGDGYVCGDPHFKTWGDENYDYHGECDLKFLSAPKFAKGLGLDIHIRTTIRFDYSYISSAAIKIGDSVIEVAGWGDYILNGVDNAELPGLLGDIPVTHVANGKDSHIFYIDVSKVSFHGDAMIKVQTFKDWVSIHIEHPQHSDYDDSVGMLGSFPEGKRLGRDGVTVITDDNAFGQEWQVLPEEGSLFAATRAPEHPAQCVLPKAGASAQSRRLAGTVITEEEARAACEHQESHVEFCVYDVLASQDLDMAGAGAF